MTSANYLTKESLFLKLPTEPTSDSITLQDLYNDLIQSTTTTTTTTTANISYDSIINKTYYLLKSLPPNTSTGICLKLWKIRLTCHLFNNNLNYAKKELINLNNSLYLQENHNISPSTLNSLGGGANNNPIYPLPKNNLLIIEYKLLILLLRLKNFPNLNLTNELYKLIWQIRLKNEQQDENNLNLILQNLSFDNAVILIITKNYLTLINFLKQLMQELKDLNRVEDKQYYSNVCLLYLVINLIVYCKQGKVSGIIDEAKKLWDEEINQTSKNSLNYSLQTISPIISQQQHQPAAGTKAIKCENIDDLIELIINDAITGRIICSMIGIWDLSNNYNFKLSETEDEGLQFTGEPLQESQDISSLSDEDLVHKCLDVLSNQWCKYINKVYGLE